MAIFQVELALPNILYHGTTIGAIAGIKEKPINSRYWNSDKDFGAGFYTTIDLFQSTRWARKPVDELVETYRKRQKQNALFSNEEFPIILADKEMPAVAILECNPAAYTDIVNVVDFRGECREWADFILRHRYSSSINHCSCNRHADIVCGIMADNDTGLVIKKFKSDNRSMDNEDDLNWFWHEIVTTKHGKVLNGLELGDQIAFFDERLNTVLQLKGYYRYNPVEYLDDVSQNNFRREWELYDAEGNLISEHKPRL